MAFFKDPGRSAARVDVATPRLRAVHDERCFGRRWWRVGGNYGRGRCDYVVPKLERLEDLELGAKSERELPAPPRARRSATSRGPGRRRGPLDDSPAPIAAPRQDVGVTRKGRV